MMRVGMGYDVHRLTEGRDLILGGVKIDWEKGLLGHSDAEQLRWEISGNIFRIQTLHIKEFPVFCYWSM